MFRNAGYKAQMICGGTPEKEREAIMQQFRNGDIQILCNVGIISEGISIDDVTCCLLLRPTESHALYWQQAMRSMRYQPGKVAKIIDCVGNYLRNPLPDADVQWSLTTQAKKRSPMNQEGDFVVRMCPQCFKVFQTAPVCPYCQAPYPLHPREIKAREEIELARITAEEAAKAEALRKKARIDQGQAQTFDELVRVAKQRGYKNPAFWASQVLRGRKRGL